MIEIIGRYKEVHSKRTKSVSANLFLTGFVCQRGVSTPRDQTSNSGNYCGGLGEGL